MACFANGIRRDALQILLITTSFSAFVVSALPATAQSVCSGGGGTVSGINSTACGGGSFASTNGSSYGNSAGVGTSGSENAFIGVSAGQNGGTVFGSTAIGYGAGASASGDYNIATGYFAGGEMSGSLNEAIGYLAGYQMSGSQNVAIGRFAGSVFYWGRQRYWQCDPGQQ